MTRTLNRRDPLHRQLTGPERGVYTLMQHDRLDHTWLCRAHTWLCHADGSECDGSVDCVVDPDRDRAYENAATALWFFTDPDAQRHETCKLE